MTEKRFTALGDTHLKDNETGKEFYAPCEWELLDLLNALHEENQDLKKQMKRLYNYFEDFFSGRVGNNDFSEMWDFVAEDEKWD